MKILSGSPDNYIELFRSSLLFAGISDEKIEIFLKASNYKLYEFLKGEELPLMPDCIPIVITGVIAAYILNKDGRRYFDNCYMPAYAAIIPQSRETGLVSTAALPEKNMPPFMRKSTEQSSLAPKKINKIYPNRITVAKRHSVVMFLDKAAYMEPNPSIFVLQSEIMRNIINIYNNASIILLDRSTYISETTAYKKVMNFLYAECSEVILTLPISRNDLADLLNIDTSTLMRVLKELKKEGIIDYNKDNITIKDFNLLS